MGSSSSKLFYITLITSYDSNTRNYNMFMEFQPLNSLIYEATHSKYSKYIYYRYIPNKNSYRINREICYPYKLKDELLKKYEEFKKDFKENCPNDQLTIIFDKDVNIKVQVIERYWKRYRWNYRKNFAAWKYHPSRLTFKID